MAAEKIMEELGKKAKKKLQPIANDASKEIAQYYQSLVNEQSAIKYVVLYNIQGNVTSRIIFDNIVNGSSPICS